MLVGNERAVSIKHFGSISDGTLAVYGEGEEVLASGPD